MTGPLPRCVPKTCICPDGSEQDLPSLPDRIKVKINKVLAKITAKIASKVTRVCQNDTEPTTCECRNALMGELDLPAQDVIDIARCRPSRCSCPGQAADGGDEWVVISPAKIIMDQLLKNVCSKETCKYKIWEPGSAIRHTTTTTYCDVPWHLMLLFYFQLSHWRT